MKVKDLPIYTEFPDENEEYIVEPRRTSALQSQLVASIKPVRILAQQWLANVEKSTNITLLSISENSTSIYDRIREEPIILARGGFITVCGLGGVVMGYRGGPLRKFVYASLFGSLATAACYTSATSTCVSKGTSWARKQYEEGKAQYWK